MGRVLVLGDDISWAQVKDNQFVAHHRDESHEPRTAPVEDLDLILVDTVRGMSLTSWCMQSLIEHGVVLVFADRAHLPAGIFLPLHGTSNHGSVLEAQFAISVPRKKRAWQALIRAKILNQSDVIAGTVTALKLQQLAKDVKSGDPENREAQAARAYWPDLFGQEFRRSGGTGATTINSALDYGYSIVRALLARSAVCAGLHPSISIHHSARVNEFALIDDLIEPLRPLVDAHIRQIGISEANEFNSDLRHAIVTVLNARVSFRGRRGPLTEVAERYLDGYRRYVMGEAQVLDTPSLTFDDRAQ